MERAVADAQIWRLVVSRGVALIFWRPNLVKPVFDLKLSRLIRQLVERLKHEDLKHQHRVKPAK